MVIKGAPRENGFFDGLEIEEIPVPVGNRRYHFELPQRYYDWSLMLALFPASATQVRKLLPSDALQPALLAPRVAVVALAAFEYRRAATLRPYNEFAVMVPVMCEPVMNPPALPFLRPDQFPSLGFYIHRLPVTTQEACDIGVAIWNFPKVVADITFEDVGWMRRCRWQDAGRTVLTLDVTVSQTRTQAKDFLAYSVKDGRLLVTRVQTRGQYHEARFRGSAWFALGEHPIAKELRQLEIANFAVDCLYSFSTEGLLPRGKPALPEVSLAGRAERGRFRSTGASLA